MPENAVSTRVESLLAQAKDLPPHEQAALLSSLHELVVPTDTDWEAAWDQECGNRLFAYRRGDVDAVDSELAMQKLRRKHGLE